MGKADSKGGPRRPRYPKAFKLEAVRLLELGQKPATQLALELGIRRSHLYRWQAQLRELGDAKAFPGAGAKPVEERSEVERLKRELAKVTEERDILKKVATYFAKELP